MSDERYAICLRGTSPAFSHRSPTETRLRSFHKGACAAAGPPLAAASGAKYFWIVAGSSFLRARTHTHTHTRKSDRCP